MYSLHIDHVVSGVLIGFHVSYWETYVFVKSGKNFEGIVIAYLALPITVWINLNLSYKAF